MMLIPQAEEQLVEMDQKYHILLGKEDFLKVIAYHKMI